MNKKLLALLAALCLMVCCLAGCTGGKEPEPEVIDYAGSITLDMDSESLKQEVTVKTYIDGDTTHFYVPTEIRDTGILKARYLGVNTPESTGQIEPWGKKASKFTKEKLSGAESIYIESNDNKWNMDSTGDRHTVWVWYKPAGAADYRCLNLELVQEGLSVAAGTVGDRYYDTASAALQQAKAHKLNAFSGQNDPDFFYGEAVEMDLKNLRTNIDLYADVKVAFEGVVTRINNNSAYVEEYDAETDTYYGMAVYYGFTSGELLEILSIGNRVRVVGKVAYWEGGGTWQVSGLTYIPLRPKDPSNTLKISDGHKASNRETDPALFMGGTVDMEALVELGSDETQLKTFKYAELIMNTTISMKNLTVISAYTTDNGGNNDGAMTLTCRAEDGTIVDVRTIVLYDENKNMLTEADFNDKTIDVIGLVDCFNGSYQIKVLTAGDITVH